MVVLVVGLPGSGKTKWVKECLGDGICYDLDHIAAALRLTEPRMEYHTASRIIANDFMYGFLRMSGECEGNVFIIQTAPCIDEVEKIDPDFVVFCMGKYDTRTRNDYLKSFDKNNAEMRIQAILEWCHDTNISTKEVRMDARRYKFDRKTYELCPEDKHYPPLPRE